MQALHVSISRDVFAMFVLEYKVYFELVCVLSD